jgi:hypothetical protein
MSAITHLYESAHCFDETSEQLSAVNLVPQEWNRITVTDGKAMSEDTLSALKWRDVYLANTIEAVSGELEDKYIGGKGIKIDKSTHTISRCDSKDYYNFTSGLTYNENFGNLVYLNLDESEDNILKLNSDGELYCDTNSTERTIDKPAQACTTNITFNSQAQGNFPQGAGLVYVTQSSGEIHYNNYYANPTIKPELNDILNESYDALYIDTSKGDTVEAHNVSKFKYYYPSDGDIIPSYVIEETKNDVSSLDSSSYNIFDPTDRRTILWINNVTASGGKNYILEGTENDIDMCPTGVLYIW